VPAKLLALAHDEPEPDPAKPKVKRALLLVTHDEA
jgi:hypothetical protein